jgi:hypothetical protein
MRIRTIPGALPHCGFYRVRVFIETAGIFGTEGMATPPRYAGQASWATVHLSP